MTQENKPGWKLEQSYTQLPDLFYTRMEPTKVEAPKLVVFNKSLAENLGLANEPDIKVLAGNEWPEGSLPIAQAYAGHQFGNFTMLGDGRAVLLGEQVTPKGTRFDIQLKGSGPTPYSRAGDGRATLGPMLREYMISEAMHGLGIPTNRSLAVAATGEDVRRETDQPGAVLTRVSESHLRVGTFEYAVQWGTVEDLRLLADYAIQRHYPEALEDENKYLSFYRKVVERQAFLIANWQLVGFIHGVMNTDNMTISGQTIDYGPCAFMDVYDPKTVFSSIDHEGRYAYQNQPAIGQWNLARLAETLLPLIHHDQEQAVQIAQEVLSDYGKIYNRAWLNGMRAKLGMITEEDQDKALIEDLLEIMETNGTDYTNTFRALTLDQTERLEMAGITTFVNWHKQWKKRLERQPQSEAEAFSLMKRSNPSVIPRNHLVEEALEAAVERKDFRVMERLMEVLKDPYAYTQEQDLYTDLPDPTDRPYRTFCGT
ncbi:protein adenylyltransferase SelO [Halobacillus litoralis]|uniref:protein adenylyltransferase SelO n=1 Tax=Halobacillus litoralis TaxID=45668 RepID=UPI001CFCC7FA|nr:YdiU family protein [Halobacillus litoralis]